MDRSEEGCGIPGFSLYGSNAEVGERGRPTDHLVVVSNFGPHGRWFGCRLLLIGAGWQLRRVSYQRLRLRSTCRRIVPGRIPRSKLGGAAPRPP